MDLDKIEEKIKEILVKSGMDKFPAHVITGQIMDVIDPRETFQEALDRCQREQELRDSILSIQYSKKHEGFKR